MTLSLASYLQDRRDNQASDIDVEKLADRLADQLYVQWEAEARHREISDPDLPVSWRPADRSLVQPWGHLEQLAASGGGWRPPASAATGPDELAGSGPDLTKVLDRVPTCRLVVLGEPGSGKTVLLIRLVLDLLRRRAPGAPVPVLVPLASWNQDESDLYSWLADQVLQEQTWLGSTAATGVRRVRALLNAGLILPVLDGLDEIHARGRDRVLVAINQTLREGAGLVLSCRVKAFRHAVRPGPGRQPVLVRGAAGIHIEPLDPTAVGEYLTRTAGEGRQTVWTPVLAALGADPPPPIARALTTPLMASLARTIYNPRASESTLNLPNPADLCNTTVLPTRAAVEEHLFDGLIRAAYRPVPDLPGGHTAEQATSYLIFLARHLEHRLHTTSLAWWELQLARPKAVSRLQVGLAASMLGFWGWATFTLTYGPFLLPMTGLALGLGVGLIPKSATPPSQVALRWPRPLHLAAGLAVGFMIGFAFGFFYDLVAHVAGSGFDFRATLGEALILSFGTVPILVIDSKKATDIRQATEARVVLARSRRVGPAAGLAAAVVGAAGDVVLYGLTDALESALYFGLIVGSTGVLDSAWGQLGLARLWLAAQGQMPLRLMTFLEDAHARGVLRQAGAVYEFRHANLQRRLANRP
jgi:GTPase SAR1 family protein